MTKTTNFGLKKPEETDFYSVDTQNDNMDAIDSVLQEFKDGTQQVGDSAKLGGKDASEYALYLDGTLTGSESILDKAKTLSYGVWQFRFDSHDATDLPRVGYKYGVATVFVRASTGISVYLWGSTSAKSIAVNHWNGTAWVGWDTDAKTSDLANYLPLSGGEVASTSANPLYVHRTNGTNIWVGYKGNNEILGFLGFSGLNNPVFTMADGTIKQLLHTGNKPSGTYTGNGDATERVIETGGIGNTCVIYVADRISLVTPQGAICKRGTDAPYSLSKDVIKFSAGKLTIKTDDGQVNSSSGTYIYEVL